MKTLRNLAIAGTVAIAAALSAGTASAAPVGLGAPVASESAATPVYFGHHGHYGYGRRLCRVPFFKLVQWYGYYGARMIKRRCYYRYY
jgi:hypothetical protein